MPPEHPDVTRKRCGGEDCGSKGHVLGDGALVTDLLCGYDGPEKKPRPDQDKNERQLIPDASAREGP